MILLRDYFVCLVSGAHRPQEADAGRLGTLFQMEAAIKNPAPAYVIACASITNLPTSTAAEPITPNRNGPYPRRCRGLNTNAAVPAARNIRVIGNYGVAFGRMHDGTHRDVVAGFSPRW